MTMGPPSDVTVIAAPSLTAMVPRISRSVLHELVRNNTLHVTLWLLGFKFSQSVIFVICLLTHRRVKKRTSTRLYGLTKVGIGLQHRHLDNRVDWHTTHTGECRCRVL